MELELETATLLAAELVVEVVVVEAHSLALLAELELVVELQRKLEAAELQLAVEEVVEAHFLALLAELEVVVELQQKAAGVERQ